MICEDAAASLETAATIATDLRDLPCHRSHASWGQFILGALLRGFVQRIVAVKRAPVDGCLKGSPGMNPPVPDQSEPLAVMLLFFLVATGTISPWSLCGLLLLWTPPDILRAVTTTVLGGSLGRLPAGVARYSREVAKEEPKPIASGEPNRLGLGQPPDG